MQAAFLLPDTGSISADKEAGDLELTWPHTRSSSLFKGPWGHTVGQVSFAVNKLSI
jgi:hypothetical protein